MANYPLDYTGPQIDALLEKIDELGEATIEEAGLMSTADKSKLNDIAPGAQENVIEQIEVGGNTLEPVNKKVTIPVDSAPASGSNNPVSSGAVFTGLGNINAKIPSEASAQNQLADKTYVNDAVSTASATFRGTFNLVSDLNLSVSATQAQTVTALNSAVATKDNNDYAFVQVPTADATPTEIARIDRYKYNGTTFAFEYSINNSGFTAAQWAAINSGINSALVTKLGNLPTASELATALLGKVDKVEGKGLSTNDYSDEEKAKVAGSADKVSGAIEGHIAALDSEGNIKDSGVSVSDIRNAMVSEGIADTMSAGTAQEFVFRQSGGDGVNYMKRIKGKTLVWNQIFLPNEVLWEGITMEQPTSSGAVRIHGTYTGTGEYGEQLYFTANNVISGHKYLFAGWVDNEKLNRAVLYNENATGIVQMGATYPQNCIINAIGSGKAEAYIELVTLSPNETVDFTIYPIVVDLTVLFNGNVPANFTVDDFFALFPNYDPSYNAGELINNTAKALETVGFNQWDEEWEVGYIWDGVTQPGNSICSKNYIPVLPSTTYYFRNTTGFLAGIHFYDSSFDCLTSDGGISPSGGTNGTFTTPAMARYMRFFLSDSGTDFIYGEICINISDASKNGTYEPYWKRVLLLNLDDFWVKDGQGNRVHITRGLKSAGSVCDEIRGGKYIKRVGSVDLGTLDWDKQIYEGTTTAFHSDVDTLKLGMNAICSKYQVSGTFTDDKTLYYSEHYATAHNVIIHDSAYDSVDAATFKAAMSGVMLNYELATPIEYELAEPMANAVIVDSLGTEKAIYPAHQDGSPSAPFCCDSNYSISIKNLVAFINAQNS